MSTIPVSSVFAIVHRTLAYLDLLTSEWAFITGISAFGIFSIGAGFVKNKIPFIVLRALTGIGTSVLRIPINYAHSPDTFFSCILDGTFGIDSDRPRLP